MVPSPPLTATMFTSARAKVRNTLTSSSRVVGVPHATPMARSGDLPRLAALFGL